MINIPIEAWTTLEGFYSAQADPMRAALIESTKTIVVWLGLLLPLEYFFSAQKFTWKGMALNLKYYPIFFVFTYLWGGLHREILVHIQIQPVFAYVAKNPIIYSILALFCFDFFYYWYHRMLHTKFFWPQHRVHHSDTYMNVMTAARHHFSENLLIIPFTTIARLIQIDLWGGWINDTSLFWWSCAGILIMQAGNFSHANIKVGFGKLNWLFTNPQVHRIHHSRERIHWDKNFAAYFPIYDVLFGTYFAPAKNEYPETGVVGYEINTISELLIHPFRSIKSLFVKSEVS